MIRHCLLVGTVGEGVFRTLDHGETFRRAMDGPGVFVESHVRALAVHPTVPTTVFMGNEQGLFRSDDGVDSWRRVDSPLNGRQVWSILLWPGNPDRMLVGVCPSCLFRSEDGGSSWVEVSCDFIRECPRIVSTRVTSLAADPGDTRAAWAGVEIDSVWRTRDGGQTWMKGGNHLSSQDIHALAVVPARDGQPRRLLAATNNDLNLSDDDGDTWRKLGIGSQLPTSYCRGMKQVSGRPERVLLGIGDGPPGWVGHIALSEDAGESWRLADIPGPANSTIWNFATHSADPALVYASSVSGQVFRSTDGGGSWTPLSREFGEIRALAWTPV